MTPEQLTLQPADQAPEAAPALPVLLNTAHARAMLRKRYPAPEWAFMEEVAPATGGGTRYADGVAVNLWQSRGHAVHGFEVKVSRSDWLRELKDPSKAEPVYRYCDMWWIVAPKGVVKDGELPPTWGLMELRASGLVVATAAPRLEAQPIGRAFFASLMRRGFESLDSMAAAKVREATTRAANDFADAVERDVKWRTRELEELKRHLKAFEEATGLTIDKYSGPPLDVIKMAQRLQILDGYGGGGSLGALTQAAQQLERAAAAVREAMGGLGAPAGV